MHAHEELDEALNARRLDLHMEWAEVASVIGISTRSLLSIRRGKTGARSLTARRMDDWLEWPPGSVENLLAGRGMPDLTQPELGERTTAQNIAESNSVLDEIQARLRTADDRERNLILELLKTLQNRQDK